MKIITLSAALILTSIYAQSQNLIGYNPKEIQKYMKENHREMNYNNVVNSKFSYLKYSDNLDNQTMLFFLNPDSVCRSVRIICDVSMKSQKLKELNSQYVKNGENKWIDRRDGKEYLIEIMEGKWSCVISIEHKK
jgi:adenosylmethionine-8-amino-7-oxononanoate aminotransferase